MAVAKADELGCGSVLISDNEMASRLTPYRDAEAQGIACEPKVLRPGACKGELATDPERLDLSRFRARR